MEPLPHSETFPAPSYLDVGTILSLFRTFSFTLYSNLVFTLNNNNKRHSILFNSILFYHCGGSEIDRKRLDMAVLTLTNVNTDDNLRDQAKLSTSNRKM